MPILKNAKKKVRSSKKKNINNNIYRQSMKTAIKDLQKAIANSNVSEAKEKLNVAITRIDKAQKKGVIHQNKAARYKSKLTKKVNTMK